MRVGDKVLSIDGKDCKDMSVTAASDLLKGPPGTKVLLSIERPGAKDLISMELQRRVPNRPSMPRAFAVLNRGYCAVVGTGLGWRNEKGVCCYQVVLLRDVPLATTLGVSTLCSYAVGEL